MDMVFRALAIYLFLVIVFKVAGRRALLQMTSFDLILLLIISEATQQALLGEDFSITGAMITITTLVVVDIIFVMKLTSKCDFLVILLSNLFRFLICNEPHQIGENLKILPFHLISLCGHSNFSWFFPNLHQHGLHQKLLAIICPLLFLP